MKVKIEEDFKTFNETNPPEQTACLGQGERGSDIFGQTKIPSSGFPQRCHRRCCLVAGSVEGGDHLEAVVEDQVGEGQRDVGAS